MGLTQNLGRLSPSIFSDASLNIGVGAAPSGSYKFEVTGTSKVSGVLTLGSTLSNGTYTYTLPSATGTLALVGGSGVGTVTSVAALTLGTSGTDLSSSVANSTTTPVITLNVPTASATNRGALSSADWTIFNNKQSALTNPVLASGTWTSGYLPKINGTYTIGNSIIQDSGSAITITGSSYLFNLSGGGTSRIAASINNTSGNLEWGLEGSAGNQLFTGMAAYQAGIGTSNNTSLNFATNTVVRMQLNASGNLGLGVTPSAWNSIFTAIEIGRLGDAIFSGSGGGTIVSANAYFGASNWIRARTAAATNYDLGSGQHRWYIAPSDSAGTNITFTQAMTLFANGNLAVGTSTDSGYKLDVNGTGRFSGQLQVSHSTASNYAAVFYNSSATGEGVTVRGGSTASHNAFIVQPYNGATTLFNILATGAATFSSSVTAGTQFNAFNDRNYLARSFIRLTSSTNNASALDIGVTDTTTTISGNYYGGGNDNTIIIGTYAYQTNQLVLKPTGNVLIGTTTDDTVNKLQVNGNVKVPVSNTYNSGSNAIKSTDSVIVSTSATTIFSSQTVGSVDSGNLVVVTGVLAGTGANFCDVVLFMTNGSATTISSQVINVPSLRTYSVSGNNLRLTMSSGTYVVATGGFIQGYNLTF